MTDLTEYPPAVVPASPWQNHQHPVADPGFFTGWNGFHVATRSGIRYRRPGSCSEGLGKPLGGNGNVGNVIRLGGVQILRIVQGVLQPWQRHPETF